MNTILDACGPFCRFRVTLGMPTAVGDMGSLTGFNPSRWSVEMFIFRDPSRELIFQILSSLRAQRSGFVSVPCRLERSAFQPPRSLSWVGLSGSRSSLS